MSVTSVVMEPHVPNVLLIDLSPRVVYVLIPAKIISTQTLQLVYAQIVTLLVKHVLGIQKPTVLHAL